jgi:NAD+ synthase (glutamine-hydrolysing)
MYHSLVFGIRDYFSKNGFSKAVIGLSGGIDSAIVATLAVAALGNDHVTGILMPSQYSSNHSISDALDLAKNLNIRTETIPIKDIYLQFSQSLNPWFKDLPEGVSEENIQARIRGTLLMAWSNKFGAILLNTTNKSEMAVGYGTLYGDMNGALSVIGDVYKSKIYELAAFINSSKILIPLNTITKPPSAELRPDQKDSDSLPDYAILDAILEYYIEYNFSESEIIEKGYDLETVKKVIRLINLNEYKRYQAAPVIRVTSKAFGPGRRIPLARKFL